MWVFTNRSNLYPNLFIVLIAEPGIGKSVVTRKIRELWQSLDEHHVSPTDVSKASLIDALVEADRKLVMPEKIPPVFQFNSLYIVSNEFGVLLPAYDAPFMNTLTDLYDGSDYDERKRTRKLSNKIDHPNVNLMAACTPAYIRDTLPAGAWDQGFLSRIIMIFSGDRMKASLFLEEEAEDRELNDHLAERINQIGNLYGKYKFTQEAAEFIDNWQLSDCPPQPDHPKLFHYSTRRTAHLLKLSMISAASVSNKLLIEKSHIVRALEWLIEAETYMPDIFKAMSSGGDGQLIEEAHFYLYKAYMQHKKPVAESRLVIFLQERTPAYNIVRIIETMEKSKYIKRVVEKGLGVCYIPETKTRL